jgi:hypothetical protein
VINQFFRGVHGLDGPDGAGAAAYGGEGLDQIAFEIGLVRNYAAKPDEFGRQLAQVPFVILLKKNQLLLHLQVLGLEDGLMVGMDGIDIQLNEGCNLPLEDFRTHLSSPSEKTP